MATSGSADFNVSGGDIINAAYRIAYNQSSEYVLDGAEIQDWLEALNMLVKNLMGPPNFLARGMKTWQRETASLTLAAQISYDLQPSGGDLAIEIPVDIININYKQTNSDSETVMGEMLYEEYLAIPDKTATGTPQRYYYERRLDKGVLYLDIVPNSTIVGNSDTLEIAYLTPLEDFDATANDPYFPQEWFRPLKWLLAVEMLPEVGRTIPPDVAALAKQSIEAANTIEPEESNDFFQPNNPESW